MSGFLVWSLGSSCLVSLGVVIDCFGNDRFADLRVSDGRPLRTYTLYITYTPYYRTPRLYLSGYLSQSEPLSPHLMMEDIVGDYADKTVTLEDFPFYSVGVKMASVHPCKHASVMKTLLDRADAALKIRLQKIKRGQAGVGGNGNSGKVESGMEGLVDELSKAQIAEKRGRDAGVAAAGGAGGDEWEVLNEGGVEEDEVAIRVDQYLVVFLKVCVTCFRMDRRSWLTLLYSSWRA